MNTPPGQGKEECKGKEAFKARSAMPGLAEEASRSALARSSDPCTLEQAQLQVKPSRALLASLGSLKQAPAFWYLGFQLCTGN